MVHRFRSLAALFVLTSATGCDDESGAPAPYVIQINSVDVFVQAVDRIKIVLRPSDAGGAPDLDKRFRDVGSPSYESGQIQTRVATDGVFQITVAGPWVLEHHTLPEALSFSLDVPLYSSEENGSSGVDDILAEVSFERDRDIDGVTTAETIAEGARHLPWPLPRGQRVQVGMECTRNALDPDQDYVRQCADHDPAAYGPAPDGGLPDGG